MKRGIFLSIALLVLVQGMSSDVSDLSWTGSREAVATPVMNVKPIHPLPDWQGPEDLPSGRAVAEEDSAGSRLKISFPVGLLATLLFFLMWKFLQSQE
jgi:hypothetical protein